MKRKIAILFLLLFINISYAKVNAVVSILPQKTFVEAIGGNKGNVSVMVKTGESSHTYEPKASQMKELSKANIYFTIGVEFENNWVPKFANQNKKMKMVSIARNVKKIGMKEILSNTETGTKFMIFHPAWGYFANDYNLVQIAIKDGGKTPKPRKVIELIEEAKRNNTKVISTNPELSDKVAKQMANELNIPVLNISPLNPKWSENLIKFAKAIANK